MRRTVKAGRPAGVHRALALCAAILLAASCTTGRPHAVTQVATIDALLAGGYDGHMTLSALAREGDTGIGTYDRLDGEMILLDGRFFRAGADGSVTRPALDTTTPFACVVKFDPGNSLDITNADYSSVQEIIRNTADAGALVAIRVDGRFAYIKTRSVPAQEKPYRPLAAITAGQPVFGRTNICGTLVGFLCPQAVKGLNVPGFHLHFLSDDHSMGGHVLEFRLIEGRARLERCRRLTTVLADAPPPASDHSADLEKVER